MSEHLSTLAASIDLPIYFVLGNHDYYGSSVASVRRAMRELGSPDLFWLPEVGHVGLTESTALVGHGGWADARLGDFSRAPLMTDFLAIKDLVNQIDRDDLLDGFENRGPLQARLRDLATMRRGRSPLIFGARPETFENVVVLTHVPPFREASWYDGQISPDEWLPNTTCKAIGDLLHEVAQANPSVRLKVLCGHTHGSGHAQIEADLAVTTQGASYGSPDFVLLEVA